MVELARILEEELEEAVEDALPSSNEVATRQRLRTENLCIGTLHF